MRNLASQQVLIKKCQPSAKVRRSQTSLLFCLLTIVLGCGEAAAQPESVPPPTKVISKTEKADLEAKTDEKDRTVFALALMDGHLKQAEKFVADQDYYNLYVELGAFHYLMDNTLDFLLRHNNGSSRMRNNLKRYEIGLRGFTPRLELIRRELPERYEPYVFKLLKYLRETRTKAIEPLFGDTVIKQ